MAKKTEKKPTIDDGLTVDKIQKRQKAYESYYTQLHTDQKEADDYYELVFDADVPGDYPARMPDTARNWVDAGVRHYTLDNPTATVYQRNNSQAARDQVAILELFYNLWLKINIIQIKSAAKKLLKRGEVFLKINMDDTYFGTEDKERLFHFPLFLSVPDPINVYCSPAHDGLVPHDVIESFNITVSEAEAMCERNGWNWKTTKAPDKTVKWMTYYGSKWRCFTLDDKPVLTPEVQPNIFGFCPYVHVDAGIGDESYEGKPEYLHRSIIWPRRDMLKLEVRNLSQMDAILVRYAWSRYKAILGDSNTDIINKLYPDGKIPTDPSKWLFEVKDKLEIEILKGESPPSELFTQLQMVRDYASPPAVLGGQRPAGVYSGQHQETLISTAKPIYKDPFKNLEDGLGVAMGMGARIIEKVYKYPVQIKDFSSEDNKGYRELKPSDINGHYDCEVQLLAEPPEATDARKYLGANLRKGGSISQRTELREYHDMSEQEIEDEMSQMFAEKGLNSIGALDVISKDAMERLGMDKELEALAEAERNAAKNIPPPKKGEGVSTTGGPIRGRTSTELESSATPGETEVAGRLAE